MSRRILVVANQRKMTRKKKALCDDVIAGLRALGHDVVVYSVTPTAEGVDLGALLGAHNIQQVVIAGGDGTINRVLQVWNQPDTPLALVPLGTYNLIATEAGYPRDVQDLVQIIHRNQQRRFFVARVNGEVCAIATGSGLDSFVLDSIDRRWKARLGRCYLLWKACRGFFAYRRPTFDVCVDGLQTQGTGVFILKGRYFAGVCFTREASMFEASLFCVINEHSSWWRQLAGIAGLVSGNFRLLNKVFKITRAQEVEISSPVGFPVQVDGDVRLKIPVRIVLHDRAFLMCVPPDR